MSHDAPVPPEALLAHREWVHALARRLVADPSRADDLEQQTWLQAMRFPPKDAGRVRGWLGKVLRNLAKEQHRRDTRRERREHAVARDRTEPSAADVVVRADAHKNVVLAVMELDEPYRSTVLLRYFDELSTSEVAERMKVPVDTVRTRLRRALERLRGRLDEGHGGDRKAWALPLLGPAVFERLTEGVLKSGAASAAVAGGVVVGTWSTTAAVAAGVAVGVIGTLLVHDPEPPPVAEPPPAITAEAPPAATGAGPAGTTAADAAEPERRDTDEPPRMTDAIAHIPAPTIPEPVGSITGHVKDDAGNPVAGVTVVATARRNWSSSGRRSRMGGSAPEPRTVDDTVRDAVQQHRWDEATTRRARSGADGSYELRGCIDEVHYLRAYKEGYRFRRVGRGDARPGEVVDWTARAQVEIPVAVVGLDGEPADEAMVHVRTEDGRRTRQRWSASDPFVVTSPGTVTLSATAGEGEELRSEEAVTQAVFGTVGNPVTLQLLGRPSIHGRLIFAQGQSWDRLYMFALRLAPGAIADDAQLMKTGQQIQVSKRADHAFKFDDLEPGRYRIGASLTDRRMPGQRLLASREVVVADRRVVADLEMPPLDAKQFVEVRILGPDGAPLEDAQVVTSFKGRKMNAAGGGSHAKREPGLFWVAHNPYGDPDDAEGRFFVEVRSKEFGTKAVEYVPGKDTELTVSFASPAQPTVTVDGFQGSGIEAHLQVAIRPVNADGSTEGPGYAHLGKQLDAEGRAALGPHEPGRYRVFLATSVGPHRARLLDSVDVELVPGANSIRLAVPPLYEIDVATGLPGGTTVEILPGRAPAMLDPYEWSTTTTDERGVARFDRLPPGLWVVAWSEGAERREMPIRVQADRSVEAAAQSLDAMRVVIDDTSGGLARQGFVNGDLLIELGGAAIEHCWSVRSHVNRVKKLHETTVVVLRNGARHEMTIAPRVLGGDLPMGGHLEAASR